MEKIYEDYVNGLKYSDPDHRKILKEISENTFKFGTPEAAIMNQMLKEGILIIANELADNGLLHKRETA